MKKPSFAISLFILFSVLLSCADIKKDKKGREDFAVFIDKFYSDIDFQLSRIEFPVPAGKLENGKVELLEKEDWTILKPIDKKNPDYEVKNIEVSDDLIEQQIIVKKSFVIKLQFSLNPVTKLWYLSSYPGIRGAKTSTTETTENPDIETVDTTAE